MSEYKIVALIVGFIVFASYLISVISAFKIWRVSQIYKKNPEARKLLGKYKITEDKIITSNLR